MYKKLSYIFSKRDKYKIALLLCIMVAGSFLELLGVAVFQPFVNIIMMPDSIQENPYLARIYQMFGCSTTESFLTVVALGIIVIYVVKNVYLWVEQNLIMKFTYGMQQKLSTRLLTTYLSEPYTFHLNKNIAELQRSMQEDTGLFTQVLMHTLQLVAEVVVCIVLGVYLFTVSNSITVVIVGLLILCVVLFTKITKRFTEQLGKEAQVYKGSGRICFTESCGRCRLIRGVGRS